MSQAVSGVSLDLPVSTPRLAAAVVLLQGDRLFWVRRDRTLRFSGGFHAFPGGALDPQDRAIGVEGFEGEEAALRVCAVRETFEETGVLLAEYDPIEPAELDGLRRSLLEGHPFAEILESLNGQSLGSNLVPAGRWVTPPISPIRFDAHFFLAQLPSHAKASVIPGELTGGEWIRPSQALEKWTRGEALLHPPNHHILSVLAGFPPESAPELLRAPPHMAPGCVPTRIEFQRGVETLPLRTPTLPPAQHTHCYMLGTGRPLIVDPGPPSASEQTRLFDRLDALSRDGRPPLGVALTHHHADHTGAALATAQRYRVPIMAHATTLERALPNPAGVQTQALCDGQPLTLPGPMPMEFTALLTEGHADGHLCFQDTASRAVIAGDLVAGGTTIILDPPEGVLSTYLASLERVLSLEPTTLYPAHGFVLTDGVATLQRYLGHRRERLREIQRALANGPLTLPELVAEVYTDTPEFLHPAAQRSALASLLHLQGQGVAEEQRGRWHCGENLSSLV